MELTANAYLGRTYDGQLIGYQVLTAARNPIRPWTRENVQRTAPGWWSVAGLVSVPDTGGFIAWGLQGQPAIAEGSFDPVTGDVSSLIPAIQRMLETQLARMPKLDMSRIGEVMAGELADIKAGIDAAIDEMRANSEAHAAVAELRVMRARMAELLGVPPSAIGERRSTSTLTTVTAPVGEMVPAMPEDKRVRVVAALDKIITKLEGQR